MNARPRPALPPLVALGLLAGCAATPVTPPGRTVETTVRVAAPPERVLRAFLDSDDLAGWWRVSRSLVQPEPGGTWAVTWDDYGADGTQHVWTGVVEEVTDRSLWVGHLVMVEPGRPLFAPLQLEVVVVPADGGTTVTVRHHGYGHGEHWDWVHDVVVRGWAHVLGDLQEWFARQEAAERS